MLHTSQYSLRVCQHSANRLPRKGFFPNEATYLIGRASCLPLRLSEVSSSPRSSTTYAPSVLFPLPSLLLLLRYRRPSLRVDAAQTPRE